MLPKKQRISRKKFNDVYSHSKIISRGSFFVLKKNNSPEFAVSVIISKKIAKKATERNHLVRKIYSLISVHKIKNNGNYLFFFQKKPTNIEISDKNLLKGLVYE